MDFKRNGMVTGHRRIEQASNSVADPRGVRGVQLNPLLAGSYMVFSLAEPPFGRQLYILRPAEPPFWQAAIPFHGYMRANKQ